MTIQTTSRTQVSNGSVIIRATAQSTPIGPVNQMAGALNGRSTSGCVIRITRTPAETTAKAKRVPIEVSPPATLIGVVPAAIITISPVMMVVIQGVRNRGWILATTGGKSPSRAIE